MKNLILLLLSILLIGTACNPKTSGKVTQTTPIPAPAPTTPAPPVEEPTTPEEIIPKEPVVEEVKVSLIASIKKTACFGNCPVFEANIYSDGRITYYGRKNVTHIGHYEAMLKDGFEAEIRDKAIAVKYFNLSRTYPANGKNIMDLPNTITYYQLNGKEQEIVNNHEAPGALKEFESFLMGITEKVEWTKVNNGNQ